MLEKPTIEFESCGESGNIYHVLSLVCSALKKQQRIQDYNDCRDRVLNSASYKIALGIIREYVELVDLDGRE